MNLVCLKDIVNDLESGSRPQGGVAKFTSGIPSVGGEHLNSDGGFKFEKIKYIPEEFAKKLTKGKIQKNDILIVKDGATTGKVSFVDDSFPYKTAFVNEHVFRLTPNESFEPKFLFYYLTSQTGNAMIMKSYRGAAQGGINQKFIEKVYVPAFDLSKQREITQQIESLLCDISINVVALSEAKSKLDLYKQSILNSAIRGKLIPQDPKDEPASKLLEKIKKEKEKLIAEKKIKKEKPLPPISEDEIPFELPDGWEWVRLGQIGNEISTGPFGSALHKHDYIKNGIPVINPMNIVDGEIVPLDNMNISTATRNKLKQYALNKGDIVIGRRGEMGRCGVVKENQEGWLCGTGSFFIKINSDLINSHYVALVISSSYGKKYLEDNAIGTTMKNLNTSVIAGLPIPLTSKRNQDQIMLSLVSTTKSIKDISSIIEEQLNKSLQLKQSILKKAFEGEL